jgi:F-type H+-transporting ATPase subunit b
VVTGIARRRTAAWLVGLVIVVGGGALRCAAAAPAAPDEASHAAESAAPAAHGAGGHGAHDPYDLTHANASSKLESPEEWRYDVSLWSLAVFLLLLALLIRFAWKPILAGLDNREKFIAGKIEEARRAAEQGAEELKAYRTKLAGAAHEAAEIVNQARRDAEAVADTVRQEAQQDAARERDRAIAEIRAAKNAALREVARKGADLAVNLAGRIVHRELRTADHHALLTEALEHFPSSN